MCMLFRFRLKGNSKKLRSKCVRNTSVVIRLCKMLLIDSETAGVLNVELRKMMSFSVYNSKLVGFYSVFHQNLFITIPFYRSSCLVSVKKMFKSISL